MHKRVCLLGVSLDTFLTILRIRDHQDHHRVERADPPSRPARRGRSRAGLALAAGVREVGTNRPAAHSARSRPPPRSRRARYWVYPYCRGREPARPYGRARCDPTAARAAGGGPRPQPSATGTAVRTSYRVRRTRLHAGRASRHSQQPFRGERAGRRSCAQYRHSIRNLIPTFSDLDVSPSVRGEHTSLVSNVSTSPYRQVILVPMNRTGPSLREAQQDEAPSSARGGRQLR